MSSNTGPVIYARVCLFAFLCVCVAASRHYSRSTGALHAPDAFGAAGELSPQPAQDSLIFFIFKSLSLFEFSSHPSASFLV